MPVSRWLAGRWKGKVMIYVLTGVGVVLLLVVDHYASRHFDEYGVYFGKPKPRTTPDDLDALGEEIRRAAHIELGCGGCLTDPDEGADILRSRYGHREMLRRCKVVVFGAEGARYPSGTVAAYGILYRRGDMRLLQELVEMRAVWLDRPLPAEFRRRLDVLIAGLCERLGVQRPEGVAELGEHDRHLLDGCWCGRDGCGPTEVVEPGRRPGNVRPARPNEMLI